MTYYLKVAKDDMSGLCNQIYTIAGCIEYCIKKGINNMICDGFLLEVKTKEYCLLSEVIDMKKINQTLKKHKLELRDATEEERKTIQFQPSPILYMANSFNSKIFTDILNNIVFLEDYNTLAKNIVKYDRINVIHLRLEYDAVNVFSKQMNIHPDVYRIVNEDRYIEAISKYIDKNVMTVILTNDKSNRVIDYMKRYKYKFILTEKKFDKRELNALVDLHIGFMCNTVLIGSYDSSFSYTILNRVLIKRNPEFFSCMIELNKYDNINRLYNYNTYDKYISDDSIKSLIFIGMDGQLYS